MRFSRFRKLNVGVIAVLGGGAVTIADGHSARADSSPPETNTCSLAGDVTGSASGGSIVTTVGQLSGVPASLPNLGPWNVVSEKAGSSIQLVGGGSLASPTIEVPWSFQPRDPAKASYGFLGIAFPEPGYVDQVGYYGYNPYGLLDASHTEPTTELVMENEFEYSPGKYDTETYFQAYQAGHVNTTRPFGYLFERDTGNVQVSLEIRNANYVISDAGANLILEEANASGTTIGSASPGARTLAISNHVPDDATQFALQDSDYGTQLVLGWVSAARSPTADHRAIGALVATADNDLALGVLSPLNADLLPAVIEASTGNIQLLSQGGTKSFGGGVGVVGIADATTAPAGNPSGGGVEYATGGAAEWRGSGGATTTMGAVGQGAVATQSVVVDHVVGGGCTLPGTSTPTTIATLALAQHHSLDALVRVTGRCTADSTSPGMKADDTFSTAFYTVWKNRSGTPEKVGHGHEISAVEEASDPSMAASSVSFVSLPGAIEIQVTPASSRWRDPSSICPIDWQVDVKPDIN